MSHFQVIPATYLLLMRGDTADPEVLLQLRGPETTFMTGHWAAGAAGHIEYAESAFVAAVREAAEELAVVVDPGDLTSLCTLQRTVPGCAAEVEQRVDFFATTWVWSGEPTVQEPGKCSELRWCRLSALPEPMVPHEAEVLRRLATGSVPAFLSLGFEEPRR